MTQPVPKSAVIQSERYCLVVGFDFSEGAGIALDQALTLAVALPLAAVHVVWVLPSNLLDDSHELGSASERLRDHVARRARSVLDASHPDGPEPPEVHVYVMPGAPARRINDLALRLGAHLIAVGSHGRAGLERVMLGCVAADVLAGAPCPVLIARGRTIDQLPHGFPNGGNQQAPAFSTDFGLSGS